MAGRSEFVEGLVRRLTPLGEVQSRPMFGGHGLFVDDLMFALITRAERCSILRLATRTAPPSKPPA